MADRIRSALQQGFLVIWEEIARDGAQAKTLLSGSARVRTARMMGDLFGTAGPDQLIFAAGYPSICREEHETVAMLAAEVDNCSLATHGRMLRHDVDLGVQSMSRAAHGRVSFAVPIAEQYSRAMLHQSAGETLRQGVELARYALDNAGGLPVDVALGGASVEDPGFVATAVNAFLDEGIATVKLCDSVGHMYPLEMETHLRRIFSECGERIGQLGVHFHNDLGFAMTSTMNAVLQGVRMVSSSWFGIAERIGLAPTEQLLFILAYPKERLTARTGIRYPLWKTPPDLTGLHDISQFLSHLLDYPLRSTDPVISPTVNDISTGAYFNDPGVFKPFEPEDVIGVPPRLVLTHLANRKIIQKAALEYDRTLRAEELEAAMAWVKQYAYTHNVSEIPADRFKQFLDELSDG